jgi:DNA modification methylase
MGTGTTKLAAATWGRNSLGLEIDAHYFALARTRMETASADLFGATSIRTVDRSQETS